MVSRRGSENKIVSTIGALLHILLVAIPKDLWRWLNLRKKSVRDQVVVITGAASGLGQRMAEIFALELGAKVAVVDIDEKKASQVANDICSRGGIAQAWRCDVSSADSMNHMAVEIKKSLGLVDIVICNAAVLYFAHTMELTADELQRAMNVNIMGILYTIRAFLSDMEKRNSGHLVGVSSIAGYFGETYGMAYCPSKFAVRGIMECLRMEMQDRKLTGIKCTTVCPYFVRTPMILNKGLRPTSRWIPFMSIERCSREIIDAVLKEKVVAFVPKWISVIPMLTSFMSVNVQKAGRSYLNCRYEPLNEKNATGSGAQKERNVCVCGSAATNNNNNSKCKERDKQAQLCNGRNDDGDNYMLCGDEDVKGKQRAKNIITGNNGWESSLLDNDDLKKTNNDDFSGKTVKRNLVTNNNVASKRHQLNVDRDAERDGCPHYTATTIHRTVNNNGDCADGKLNLINSRKSEGAAVERQPIANNNNVSGCCFETMSYFRSPNLVWFLIIPPAMALTFLVWYSPELFNQEILGGAGNFLHLLGTNHSTLMLVVNVLAWFAHFCEAEYALFVCNDLNFSHACALKWFIQTFVLGFPSLSILLSYRRKKKFSK